MPKLLATSWKKAASETILMGIDAGYGQRADVPSVDDRAGRVT